MPSRAEVQAAYEATEYVVFGKDEFVLKVNEYSAPLRLVYNDLGVKSVLHITAWNPFSRLLALEENRQRQALLFQTVTNSGLVFCAGFGRDPTGEWSGEEHLVVFGVDRDYAVRLAGEFEQNAVLWADESAVPELLWLVD